MMKKTGKIVFLALALCLVFGICALPGMTAYAADPVPVSYLDSEGVLQNCTKYTELNGHEKTWDGSRGEIWLVAGDVDYDRMRVTVKGTVNLILKDGCTLDISYGIQVEAGNTLNIYGQSEGENAGKLLILNENNDDAGIGANRNTTTGGTGAACGTVTINGGNLDIETKDGAGIGGGAGYAGPGCTAGCGGNVTMNGGSIMIATDGGAGIGGGDGYMGIGGNGGTFTMNGGSLAISVKFTGAGIGGGGGYVGIGGTGGTVNINGGTVNIVSQYGTGIGGGSGYNGKGTGGKGGSVTISGGTVDIQSTYASHAIGMGQGGNDDGTVTVDPLEHFALAVSVGSEKTALEGSPFTEKAAITDKISGQKIFHSKALPVISFDANGGCFGGDPESVVTEKIIDEDGHIALPSDPVLDGYCIVGWYTAKEGGEKVTEDTVFTKGTTVYAKWVIVLPFTDVEKGRWSYSDIAYVYVAGLMNGTSATKFAPTVAASRAMIVTTLYRMEKEPTVSGSVTFKDVKAGMWYTKGVLWASKNGIVKGYSDTKFGPDDNVTREQLALILYRYAQYKNMDVSARADLSEFSDSGKVASWAQDAMSWANAEGLITGTDKNELLPQGVATREQVAAILHRFLVG